MSKRKYVAAAAAAGALAFFTSSYGQRTTSWFVEWLQNINAKLTYSLNTSICEICKRDINDENKISLKCEHSFHLSCYTLLQREGQNKCPLCYKNVN